MTAPQVDITPDAPRPAEPAVDAAAMHALLAERGILLAYVNAILRDLHESEDVLQEALVIAMRQRFDDADHARAWIRVCARNLAMNALRRKKRRAVLPPEVLDLLEPEWRALGDGPSHGERLAALRACCELLPEFGRRLIELRFARGLDGDGIAAAVGRPLNTVYVGLSRVYRKLAACVERRLGDA